MRLGQSIMDIIETIPALKQAVATCKQQGKTVALVPTMGALHAGHMALVNAAKANGHEVFVSIFVNPKQFGPNEDFGRYPRTFKKDCALAKAHQVHAIWAPAVEVMYPGGFATNIHVAQLGDGLCGAHRKGHFDGVATVVSKLLLQTGAEHAYFGEKDFQQLAIIRRMVEDLNIPCAVHNVPTVREEDGLALSSRNIYLSEEARGVAPRMYEILQSIASRITAGEKNLPLMLNNAKYALQRLGFSSIDYLEYVDAATLQPLSKRTPNSRLLIAAFLENTRLIDNIEVL